MATWIKIDWQAMTLMASAGANTTIRQMWCHLIEVKNATEHRTHCGREVQTALNRSGDLGSKLIDRQSDPTLGCTTSPPRRRDAILPAEMWDTALFGKGLRSGFP